MAFGMRIKKPDVVLIDGRFRVAVFAQALVRAAPGTRIIFDDFTVRDHYHVVKELLSPEQVSGLQALFIVPRKIDRTLASVMVNEFKNVWQ